MSGGIDTSTGGAGYIPPGYPGVQEGEAPATTKEGQAPATVKETEEMPYLAESSLEDLSLEELSDKIEELLDYPPHLPQLEPTKEVGTLLSIFPGIEAIQEQSAATFPEEWTKNLEEFFSEELMAEIKEFETDATKPRTGEIFDAPQFGDSEWGNVYNAIMGDTVFTDVLNQLKVAKGEEKVEPLETPMQREPAGEKEFRFAGNYLAVITSLLRHINTVKTRIAEIDTDNMTRLSKVEEAEAKRLVGMAMERLEKNVIERELARKAESAKWVNFVAMSIGTLAMTVMTAGSSWALTGMLMGAWAATTTMQGLEMGGIDVAAKLAKAFGLDPEKDKWVAKLLISAVIATVTVAAIGTAFLTKLGDIGQFTGKSVASVTAINLVPQAMMYSNFLFEIVVKIAKAAGMEEEDAMWMAMALNLILMVAMMALMFRMGPQLKMKPPTEGSPGSITPGGPPTPGAPGSPGSTTAGAGPPGSPPRMGSSTVSGRADGAATRPSGQESATAERVRGTQQELNTTTTNARNNVNSTQREMANLTTREKTRSVEQAVEQIAEAMSALAMVASGVSQLYLAYLTHERAELKYEIAVLDAARKVYSTLMQMYSETRAGLVADLQNGMFQFSVSMMQMFEKMVKSHSQELDALYAAILAR